MALIVQKFGGTSLANLSMIKRAVDKVIDTYDRGNDVIVVLSAMAGVTDSLICLAQEASIVPNKRELDVLLATGEQTSVAILAMMINKMGYKAQSVLAHQLGIVTDSSHGNARILEIDVSSIEAIINEKKIAVVAGFQGCDNKGNITTLGRGGSDTSAVAIAAALKASFCEIYTDVDGIYTADPNVCPKAKKINRISYDQMLYMANLGTKVLHHDSISFAKKYKIKIHVRSSFSSNKGTLVSENFQMKQSCISGITYDLGYARIMFKGVSDDSIAMKYILIPLIEAGIFVDICIKNNIGNGLADFIFIVSKIDFKRVFEIERRVAKFVKVLDFSASLDNAKISVVGFGMNDHIEIALTMFKTLEKEKIEAIMVNSSGTKISCFVKEKHFASAVKLLHSVFDLG